MLSPKKSYFCNYYLYIIQISLEYLTNKLNDKIVIFIFYINFFCQNLLLCFDKST